MGSLSIHTVITGTIGGEKLRTTKTTMRTVGAEKFDQIRTIADNNTKETLWAASSSPISSFSTAIVVVDPDNVYADDAAEAQLVVEFQGDGATAFSAMVRREAPLILTTDDIGADADTLTEVIDTIIAKNTNADDAGDVAVRLILLT